ncbi:hypothetical protein CMI38_01980 [Candidatus Pacearchaeota archaeon]|nr:hypothetical protein [Candidatus Pacearchaeota archaeon]
MELKNILELFPKKNILVIGDIMLDKYTEGFVERISPEAPVPVLRVENHYYKLGGAANVAMNLSNLSPEGNITLSGFTGKDPESIFLKKTLEENNINTCLDENSSTILKERFMGKSSGHPQHILRVDREENKPKLFTQEIKKNLMHLSEKADLIILSDYAKGTITLDLINTLNNFKNKLIIDPKPKNPDFKSIYQDSLAITPNKKEALEMSGLNDIYDAGIKLSKDFNSNIFVKEGGEGLTIFPNNNHPIKVPTNKETNFEETGAGDTMIAAIALSLATNNSLENAAKIGNHAARLTVKKIGTHAPTLNELHRSIIENETP